MVLLFEKHPNLYLIILISLDSSLLSDIMLLLTGVFR